MAQRGEQRTGPLRKLRDKLPSIPTGFRLSTIMPTHSIVPQRIAEDTRCPKSDEAALAGGCVRIRLRRVTSAAGVVCDANCTTASEPRGSGKCAAEAGCFNR